MIGHQPVSPDLGAPSTWSQTFEPPSGRSIWIQNEVSIKINRLRPAPALIPKFVRRQQVGASTGVVGKLGHAPPPIELGDRRHHGPSLRLGAGEADCIRQFVLRYINRRLHKAILAILRPRIGRLRNMLLRNTPTSMSADTGVVRDSGLASASLSPASKSARLRSESGLSPHLPRTAPPVLASAWRLR